MYNKMFGWMEIFCRRMGQRQYIRVRKKLLVVRNGDWSFNKLENNSLTYNLVSDVDYHLWNWAKSGKDFIKLGWTPQLKNLGPIYMLRFCHAKLNSCQAWVKLDKMHGRPSTSESKSLIWFGRQLSLTRFAMPLDSGRAVTQTLCLCRVGP